MHIHFLGIGGSGMAGVASLAEKMGYTVTGCDLEAQTAYRGDIYQGHSAGHLRGVDLLVVTPAVFYQNSKNPELLAGQKRGIAMTWQEFLGKVLLKHKKVIAIAGTHGKSTTTAMVGKLLIDNGFDPIVVVGAIVPEWGGSSRFGKGDYAVVEADEFNNNFLNYYPEIEIINNIEFDHPDFFKDEEDFRKSFEKFIKNLTGRKILITQKDSLGKRFNLRILGEHNQRNANMVFVLGKKLGIREDKIIQSIESFEGIGRRLELIADRGGVKVYDDYAHHPTAIAATLEGVRQKYPDSKILAVVEPHGYKRTKALLPKYKGVFDAVDKVIVGPIFKARDQIDESITPQKVAAASEHRNAMGVDSAKEIFKICLPAGKAGNLEFGAYDVVVVMGAGKSYLWAREIADSFPVSFSNLTTFGVGGRIKKLVEVKTKEEIPGVIRAVKKEKLPIFILGGGSDILVSDRDFPGVVIRYMGEKMFLEGGILTAEAGVNWDNLVEYSVKNGLQGMECLSGIPGTVGASPIQNIGAYGQEVADTFIKLTAYDIEKEEFVIFKKSDCQFGYRESVFKEKTHWQKFIIVDVTFGLKRNAQPTTTYESLRGCLGPSPTLQEVRGAVLKIRGEKLEDPKMVGNAGSFFKNPIVTLDQKEELKRKHPDVRVFPFGKKYKISAAWLVEKAGWKGKTHKGAAVSSKHSLIIINKGDAKAQDIRELSEMIIEDVDKKFGLKLKREVHLINF